MSWNTFLEPSFLRLLRAMEIALVRHQWDKPNLSGSFKNLSYGHLTSGCAVYFRLLLVATGTDLDYSILDI